MLKWGAANINELIKKVASSNWPKFFSQSVKIFLAGVPLYLIHKSWTRKIRIHGQNFELPSSFSFWRQYSWFKYFYFIKLLKNQPYMYTGSSERRKKTHFQKLISNARRVNDIFDHKQVTNAQNQEVLSNKLLHY